MVECCVRKCTALCTYIQFRCKFTHVCVQIYTIPDSVIEIEMDVLPNQIRSLVRLLLNTHTTEKLVQNNEIGRK